MLAFAAVLAKRLAHAMLFPRAMENTLSMLISAYLADLVRAVALLMLFPNNIFNIIKTTSKLVVCANP